MKNIVLCCDGTANEFSDHNTNVVKLYQLLEKDPARQVTYYHPGVGTMEAVGALTSVARKITKVLGYVIGYGLEDDVRAAYLFLMRTYSPGDRIFMFGFSRGAYTVRAVAALLHMYGLMEGNSEALIPYAIRLQSAISKEGEKADKVFALAQQFKATFSRPPVPIYFTALWDTVSSVGWKTNPLKLPYTADNPDIDVARHAVSIDERRAFFRNHLWRPKPPNGGPRQLKQVWFPGDHSDVGGGRAEIESAQSRIALVWMLREAIAAGLLVDETAAATLAASSGTPADLPRLHDKLRENALWWILEFLPFPHYDYAIGKTSWRMNRARRRTIPPGSFIHSSAYARGPDYVRLLPPNGISTD